MRERRGVIFFKTVVLLGLWIGLAGGVSAEKAPDWEFEIKESAVADFEMPTFHEKDSAWLFTCRLRVKSLNLVSPLSQLHFTGLAALEEGPEEEEAEQEVLWEKDHTIRRDNFEAAYGGGRSQFVRVFLKDVPKGVVLLRLSYGDEDEAEATE